jgi:hypothetical protein
MLMFSEREKKTGTHMKRKRTFPQVLGYPVASCLSQVVQKKTRTVWEKERERGRGEGVVGKK